MEPGYQGVPLLSSLRESLIFHMVVSFGNITYNVGVLYIFQYIKYITIDLAKKNALLRMSANDPN